jgi:hypothetical protein
MFLSELNGPVPAADPVVPAPLLCESSFCVTRDMEVALINNRLIIIIN